MSWVADANAVITNNINVNVNIPTGVELEPISSDEGLGMLKTSNMNAADMRICIASIHHLLVLKMSTTGLHSGLRVHGR